LIAYVGNEIHRVSPSDIFYIETVDNKTFLYCESDVYEAKQKLYELEELRMTDFLRISKSVIVNLSKIKSLAPSMSGKLEATLKNGERVVISRQYVNELKKNLGI
jgi:DNA-binding LytR/AlgR family response regulator